MTEPTGAIAPHEGLGELPSAVGPSDQQTQALNEQWNTYSSVEAVLVAQNITPPMSPLVAMPTITPEILNGLNGNQYMETYAAFDAWHNFIGETLSQLENIILQIDNEVLDLDAHIRQQLIDNARVTQTKKPAADEVKLAIQLHPRRRFLIFELQKNKQHLNRLEAKQKSLGRSEKMMSRNIERIKAANESAGGYGGIQARASGSPIPPRMG